MKGTYSSAVRDGKMHRLYVFDLGAGNVALGGRSLDFNHEGLCSFMEIEPGMDDRQLIQVDSELFIEANRHVFRLAGEILQVLVAGCEG